MRPRVPRSILTPLLLAGLAACSEGEPAPECPDAKDAGTVQPGFVVDREIQKTIEFFQLTVLEEKTQKGSRITCDDIPGTYRLGNPELVLLGSSKITRKTTGSDPEVISKVNIPANKRVIVVVEGMATDAQKRVHIVARGCEDEVIYQPCTSPLLEVDVIATTGTGCTADSDCEPGMTCNKGTYFGGGYCAKINCAKDQSCPPGSDCVKDSARAGLCARRCTSVTDCKLTKLQTSSPQSCECRKGAFASRVNVCVSVLYGPDMACLDAGI